MVETSVVIRSFNEADHIGDVLEAVSGQAYQDYEIILVDSGSTDGTLEIAEGYVDKIEFVAPQNFTFGYSCNAGCEAASGTFVSFLSAHAVPTDEDWLGNMVENLRSNTVAMTYSNQIGVEETKFSEKRLFDQLFPDQSKKQTPPDYWANNASSIIKKELWKEHQFDEYLTGHEDIEWAKHFMDQGYEVVYESNSCIYHIHNESWSQIFNRFKREAIADVEIGVKTPGDRWSEYISIPIDILSDIRAAIKHNQLDLQLLSEITKFRYYQHRGTASGLLTDRDLDADRFEFFYQGANKTVQIDRSGASSIQHQPLPKVKPNEVLIRIHYVGVLPSIRPDYDCDKDVVVPEGSYVGTIKEIGANVDSVSVGEIVTGESVFHCGVCQSCSAGDSAQCDNPTVLGVNTSYGAYSQFVTIPSDYVYSLPKNIDPKLGTLVQTVAHLSEQIEQAVGLLDQDRECIIAGNGAHAEIVRQIASRTYQCSTQHSTATVGDILNGKNRVSTADLLVDTTGDPNVIQYLIDNSAQKAVILLLSMDDTEFMLRGSHLNNNTIITANSNARGSIEAGLTRLSELELDPIVSDSYSLAEYDEANTVAKQNETFPIIKMDS